MKNLSLFLVVSILLFLSSSCSNKDITAPKNGIKSGKVLLKIDVKNAPSNVVTIVAYLTRSGYETISHYLNLLSDSTADITFENIEVGIWHLKVDAKDNNQKILYAGETDINILENITVEVNLTLIPTTTGTGSVHINVSWGFPINLWIDYKFNPIFTIYHSPTNPPGGVSESKILFENGKYKMWYLNTYESGRGDVGYAESVDGINWNNVSSSAVLTAGQSGAWDDYTVGPAFIIKENGLYKMYYNGWQTYYGMSSIGLAVSVDGIHWEKNPNPVLSANEQEYRIGAHALIKKEGMYYLYYDSKTQYSSEFKINVATSTDGVHFNRYQNNPILISSQQWEGIGVVYSTVILEDGVFKMIYNNNSRTGLGKATSIDGFNWTKGIDNPIFTIEDIYNHWSSIITYPNLGKYGNQYRIYYGGDIGGIKNIGLATSNKF